MAKQRLLILFAVLIGGMALTSCSDKDGNEASPSDSTTGQLADIHDQHGIKLMHKPTQPGVYIHRGQRVSIGIAH